MAAECGSLFAGLGPAQPRQTTKMPHRGRDRRSKYFCFTINNPSDDEKAHMRNRAMLDTAGVTYIVWQVERGEAGTPHVQGYVEFKRRQRPTARSIKTVVGRRAHIEIRRGTADEAADYCKKEESRVEPGDEWGVISVSGGQGARNDLKKVKESIDAGMGVRELYDEHFAHMIRYRRSFQEYMNTTRGRTPGEDGDFPPIQVEWWWGPTGSGKTRDAWRRLSTTTVGFLGTYTKPGSTRWWDGYTGQTQVLIDDISPTMTQFSTLLQWLDRYPCQVEYKGGYIQLQATLIIITAPLKPEDLFHDVRGGSIGQLLRRINVVRAFGEADGLAERAGGAVAGFQL